MRDQLLDWDDPAVQELLLKVLVQQQRIMEELCHQVSAARLTAQELSGNARTGSSEFLEPPGSAPSSSRCRPGETEGTSNTEELRRLQVDVQAGQPEHQHESPGATFIWSAAKTNANQHLLIPSKDIDCKMADRWGFNIDQTANTLDQSPCTSVSHVLGDIPAPEPDQLVINKLDGRSGSCQSDDDLVDEHTQHSPQPTHPGKNFVPAEHSVAVIQSSHGQQDNIVQSLNGSPIMPGSFSEFSGDQREQAHESSTGGEALRANKVNSSAEKADVVSELDIRANGCAVVQINSFLDRLLDNGSAFVVVNRSCIKVRNTNSSPQHNVGHRSLCTTTKVKLSHATVFQPKRPEVCSKRFSLQEGLEMLQYEPWNPGGW